MSHRLIRDTYPALWAWVRKFEDLSGVGVEGEGEVAYESGEVVDSLLQFAAQVYLPFLQANSSAIDSGEKEVTVGCPKSHGTMNLQFCCS